MLSVYSLMTSQTKHTAITGTRVHKENLTHALEGAPGLTSSDYLQHPQTPQSIFWLLTAKIRLACFYTSYKWTRECVLTLSDAFCFTLYLCDLSILFCVIANYWFTYLLYYWWTFELHSVGFTDNTAINTLVRPFWCTYHLCTSLSGKLLVLKY